VLAADEIVTDVEVPAMSAHGWAVEELSRRAGDFAIVAVVALVGLDRRGYVDDARVAFGGVGDRPVHAGAAEDALRGREPTAEVLARAAQVAREALAPTVRCLRLRRLSTSRGRCAVPARAHPRCRAGAAMIARLVLNGRPREVDVRPNQTLLELLRDTLGIFDVKEGCDEGVCGVCTVLLDGRPASSCLVLAAGVRGRAVLTLRGLERDGGLHPLQEAFIRHGAVQCGFCTPGMLLTTLAFLERQPHPDREAIRAALEGNLCRCTGYTKIVDAVEAYVRAHD
jgi:carbon-monoxide dehydrogenase small subunit